MGFSGVDNNIYRIHATKPQFGSFTAKKPATSPVKTPEIKDTFKKRNDPTKDNKFSFLEFGKNVAKGSVQFFTDIAKSIVKHPFIAVPLMVIGGAAASTPLGFAALAGYGVTAGVFNLLLMGIKTGNLIHKNKWDELETQGKDLGKTITGTTISAIGAVKAIRQFPGAANTEKLTAIKKAGNIGNNIGWNVTKNGICAPFRAFKKYALKKPVENGILIKPIKADYQKFVSGLEGVGKAKLFDWKFKKPVQAIIMALRGRSGD